MIAERLEKLVEEMVDKGVQFEDAVREFEKRFISRVLARHDGSLTQAAERLGFHRNTLTRKMVTYKLKRGGANAHLLDELPARLLLALTA